MGDGRIEVETTNEPCKKKIGGRCIISTNIVLSLGHGLIYIIAVKDCGSFFL
jgi:hypothetical protein